MSSNLLTRGFAILILASLLSASFPFSEGDDEPSAEGTPTRGDLVLAPGESLNLTGSHSYERVILSSGCDLVLWRCSMEITGSSHDIPSFIGEVRDLTVRDSYLNLTGAHATGPSKDEGAGSLFDIRVTGELAVTGSHIFLKGGFGWSASAPGAYTTDDLSGRRFTGGNATFRIQMTGVGPVSFEDSGMVLFGGHGGDAPDGEDRSDNDPTVPGGYTKGGDVSGYVGMGGSTEFSLVAEDSVVSFTEVSIEMISGRGGDAGDAGSIVHMGDLQLGPGTSAGGYSSGYVGSALHEAGQVSDSVGCGGDSRFVLRSGSVMASSWSVIARAGIGGDAGDGGDCRAKGWYPTGDFTRTTGGGGGGGYSGGYSHSSQGGDGGDVTGRVGSGGDSNVTMLASGRITFRDVSIESAGGDGGKRGEGGLGGGVDNGIDRFDGGGGGGGGYSGGGGRDAMVPTRGIGGSGGQVGPDVASGGSSTLRIEANHISADGPTRIVQSSGEGDGHIPRAAESGEVIAGNLYGGPPGSHGLGSPGNGTIEKVMGSPSPIPVLPEEGAALKDPVIGFRWEDAMESLYGNMPEYQLRFLGSPDPEDIISEVRTIVPSCYQEADPGDGVYYWRVRVSGPLATSDWSPPYEIVLDRGDPDPQDPTPLVWVPSFDTRVSVGVKDDISGVDEAACEVKVDRVGGPMGSWTAPSRAVEIDRLNTRLEVLVPNDEGTYEIWARAMDMAGNGPALGGPYRFGVDGTPPVASSPGPVGWVGAGPHLSFKASDALSGIDPMVEVEFRDQDGTFSRTPVLFEDAGVGSFLSVGCCEAPDGELDMWMNVSDRAGNVLRIGPVTIGIDGQEPELEMVAPSPGQWFSVRRPRFEVLASDGMSGISQVAFTLYDEQGSAIERSVPGTLVGDVYVHTPGEDLGDGTFIVEAAAFDRAGNVRGTGKVSFGVDATDPVLAIISTEGIPFRSPLAIDYRVEDEVSGLDAVHFELLGPVPTGFDAMERIDMGAIPPGGTGRFAPALAERREPYFWRLTASDSAGNEMFTTPVNRWDTGPPSWSLKDLDGRTLGPGMDLEASLEDGTGIDPASIRYRIDGGKWTTLTDVVPDRWFDGPAGTRVANRTSLGIPLPSGTSGDVMIEVSWKDPLYSSPTRNASVVVHVDAEPPSLTMVSRPVWGSRSVELNVSGIRDRSGMDPDSYRIRIDDGPWSAIGPDGDPRWENFSGDGGTISATVEWGRERIVTFSVSDMWGNEAISQVTVRVTREPSAIIQGLPRDLGVRSGEEMRLTAMASDPDEDPLDIEWYMDGVRDGEGSIYKPVLSDGDHVIGLRATDGFHVVWENVTVSAEMPAEGREVNVGAIVGGAGIGFFLLMAIAVGAYLFIMGVPGKAMASGDTETKPDRAGQREESETGSKCVICMRGIPERAADVKCRCGALFHRTCARNEGVCPSCGRELLIPR